MDLISMELQATMEDPAITGTLTATIINIRRASIEARDISPKETDCMAPREQRTEDRQKMRTNRFIPNRIQKINSGWAT